MTAQFIREYLMAAYFAARVEAYTTSDWTKAIRIEESLHFVEREQ